MSELKNLLAALSLAKSEFTVLTREKKGAFGKYAPLESVIESTLPALTKHGLVIVHSTNTDGNGNTDLHTKLYHVESGEFLESILPIVPDKPGNQGLGASLTYLRRYSETMLLDLGTEDDDDLGDGKVTKPAPKPQTKAEAKPDESTKDKLLDKLRGQAMALAGELLLSEDLIKQQIQAKFGLASRTEMAAAQWSEYISSLNKLKNEWSTKMDADTAPFFNAMKAATPICRKKLLEFFNVPNVLRIAKEQFAMWQVTLESIIVEESQPEL